MKQPTNSEIIHLEIPAIEWQEICRKVEAYDKICAKRSAEAKARNARMTPEQRSTNAKKAVQARMAKYGQKSRKDS